MIKILFCDIDDTMTTDGLIPREAYNALWDAHEAGIRVVPVTGRPAGWCDHIARQWPVDGVIGENGAFYFRKVAGGFARVHSQSERERVLNRCKLDAIREEVLQRVPGAGVAADQFCRQYDLAIDFCEDVPTLDKAAIAEIVAIFERHGAVAKVSSIHVNGWFGEFDKLTMTRRYIADIDGIAFERARHNYAFVGDSPNDEPMFAAFALSFGVANIAPFLTDLTHRPTHITASRGGAGYAEVVAELIAKNRRGAGERC